MFWGDIRAKRLGALSIASSSYARRQVLAGMTEKKTAWQRTVDAVHAVDAVGLLLFGFALALLLTPATLEQLAKGGYKNPSLIAMYCVGGVLFIAFVVWDTRYARSPIFPRRLVNRTFVSSSDT
jgi:hypothetical protein